MAHKREGTRHFDSPTFSSIALERGKLALKDRHPAVAAAAAAADSVYIIIIMVA